MAVAHFANASLGESREQYYMPPLNPSKLRTPPVAAPIKIDRVASLNSAVISMSP